MRRKKASGMNQPPLPSPTLTRAMWKPSRQFKINVVAYGWFLVSLFVIGVLAWQFRVLWLVPIILLAVALLKLAQRWK